LIGDGGSQHVTGDVSRRSGKRKCGKRNHY
jgi:hypothetical protein